MTEHTPGPWEQDCNTVRTTRGIIAECLTPQKGGVFDCNANARLIAAAPEMLEALQRVLSLLVVDSEPPSLVTIEDGQDLSLVETYEAVSAAVAKATETTIVRRE